MIGDTMSLMQSAENLSIPQLQQSIQSGTLPAYTGIPILQRKLKQKQEALAPEVPPTATQPVASQVMSQARGLPVLPSNLNFADGGIVAFAGGGPTESMSEQLKRLLAEQRAAEYAEYGNTGWTPEDVAQYTSNKFQNPRSLPLGRKAPAVTGQQASWQDMLNAQARLKAQTGMGIHDPNTIELPPYNEPAGSATPRKAQLPSSVVYTPEGEAQITNPVGKYKVFEGDVLPPEETPYTKARGVPNQAAIDSTARVIPPGVNPNVSAEQAREAYKAQGYRPMNAGQAREEKLRAANARHDAGRVKTAAEATPEEIAASEARLAARFPTATKIADIGGKMLGLGMLPSYLDTLDLSGFNKQPVVGRPDTTSDKVKAQATKNVLNQLGYDTSANQDAIDAAKRAAVGEDKPTASFNNIFSTRKEDYLNSQAAGAPVASGYSTSPYAIAPPPASTAPSAFPTAAWESMQPTAEERDPAAQAAQMRAMLGEDPERAKLVEKIAKREEDLGLSERRAPWLALMQAGLATMGGKSPFAMANIGEGGIAGINAYMKSQDRLEDQRDKLLDMQGKLADKKRSEDIAVAKYGMDSSQAAKAAARTTKQAELTQQQAYEANKAKMEFDYWTAQQRYGLEAQQVAAQGRYYDKSRMEEVVHDALARDPANKGKSDTELWNMTYNTTRGLGDTAEHRSIQDLNATLKNLYAEYNSEQDQNKKAEIFADIKAHEARLAQLHGVQPLPTPTDRKPIEKFYKP